MVLGSPWMTVDGPLQATLSVSSRTAPRSATRMEGSALASGEIRPPLWAKLRRDESGAVASWHSLVDHSADVAAVFEALLAIPVIACRLALLAGVGQLPSVWHDRLTSFVFLHDLGKANRGFHQRWHQGARPVGHILPAVFLCLAQDHLERVHKALPIKAVASWGGDPGAFLAILAHHGRPVPIGQAGDHAHEWRAGADGDPVADLSELGSALLRWLPGAFVAGGTPLPDKAPHFWHAVAGLAMLADWVGSDAAQFPFSNGNCPDRMAWARKKAPSVLGQLGFDPARFRAALPGAPDFNSIAPWPVRPAQEAAAKAPGRTVVFESETGSGKTEAALYRFARLFAAGEVDGLYFALPTRVAATAMFERVKQTVDRLFGVENKPAVVLAVPGYPRVDDATAHLLPGFEVLWDDEPDAATKLARWAGERPKRYLAGTIAVGTIDQALLGAIQVKHAHLRSACLLRHLLVVDEVHASDAYMEQLLSHLLSFHTTAGGHALLLSATLGSSARVRLLQTPRAEPPPLSDAERTPYPAISTDVQPSPAGLAGTGRDKPVTLSLDTNIADPTVIAARCARGGAGWCQGAGRTQSAARGGGDSTGPVRAFVRRPGVVPVQGSADASSRTVRARGPNVARRCRRNGDWAPSGAGWARSYWHSDARAEPRHRC